MYPCAPTGIKFKAFVKQTNPDDLLEKPARHQNYLPVTSLTGDKARQFYEDILNQPSSCVPVKKKELPMPHCKQPQSKQFRGTDLLWMAQNNDVANLNKFFSQKWDCDINVVDDFGWTPLMCAACSGAEEAVRILLENGADPHRCDRLRNTALTLAKQKNRRTIVEILENCDKDEEKEEEEEGVGDAEDAKDPSKPFFCIVCRGNFMSKRRHESSTLHLFNCPTKTCTFYGIPESNKGFQLLLKEGWDKERGLGRDGRGRKFPVKAVMKKDRRGIGAFPVPENNSRDGHHTVKYENKQKRMQKTWKEKNLERNFRLEFN